MLEEAWGGGKAVARVAARPRGRRRRYWQIHPVRHTPLVQSLAARHGAPLATVPHLPLTQLPLTQSVPAMHASPGDHLHVPLAVRSVQ